MWRGAGAVPLGHDEEKWNPVFLTNHATTGKREWDDVSFKHHPTLERSKTGKPLVMLRIAFDQVNLIKRDTP